MPIKTIESASEDTTKKYKTPFLINCRSCIHSKNITDDDSICQSKPVALDCEMVGVGPNKSSALGRVSIVDYNGTVLYDVMVRPDESITDYRTPWSGIRESDMRRAIPFECAKSQVKRIIKDRIVVGHMVNNDFSVLDIIHPKNLIRDTAKAPYAKKLVGYSPRLPISLRTLTFHLFSVRIQNGEHCSTEDARATMAIYRLVEETWESSLKEQNVRPSKNLLKRKVELSDDPNILKLKHRRHSFPVNQSPIVSQTDISFLDDSYWPN